MGFGITLVDTPGVGSVHQHNTETSYCYIEKSNAVLFLLSIDRHFVPRCKVAAPAADPRHPSG
ncbi:MAG TPA: hypothetical protein DD738_04360, partial [Ruminiclostridium sp.]|nr:hypothetical protein [Ruminiclostridium sp.]